MDITAAAANPQAAAHSREGGTVADKVVTQVVALLDGLAPYELAYIKAECTKRIAAAKEAN